MKPLDYRAVFYIANIAKQSVQNIGDSMSTIFYIVQYID